VQGQCRSNGQSGGSGKGAIVDKYAVGCAGCGDKESKDGEGVIMTELAQKLDEFISKEYEEYSGITNTFTIDTTDKADWALRKIAKYQGAINEAKALAAKRTQQIKAWLEAIEEDNQQQISFFENLLEPYAKKQLEGAKKRSIKLPIGTFGFRAQQLEFTYNEELLTKWAEKNTPDYVKKDPVLQWGEFKKAMSLDETGEGETKKLVMVSPDGEVVPHITITKTPDKFYVKVEE
jgi:hypothetical protein